MILLNRLLTEATGKASYPVSSGIIPRRLYLTEAARKNRGQSSDFDVMCRSHKTGACFAYPAGKIW